MIVSVLDYPAAREVLSAAGDALAGRTVVNLTNGTPKDARDMAAWVAGKGARYLDGGIMAVPAMIGGPGSLVLYRCTETPTFAQLGDIQFYAPGASVLL